MILRVWSTCSRSLVGLPSDLNGEYAAWTSTITAENAYKNFTFKTKIIPEHFQNNSLRF